MIVIDHISTIGILFAKIAKRRIELTHKNEDGMTLIKELCQLKVGLGVVAERKNATGDDDDDAKSPLYHKVLNSRTIVSHHDVPSSRRQTLIFELIVQYWNRSEAVACNHIIIIEE